MGPEVHKGSLVACMHRSGRRKEVRNFATTRGGELQAMRGWLLAAG
jgi:hypothetical protein